MPRRKPSPVKVGVVGVGHLGQHHARIFKELPHAELVGVAESNPKRAKEIGERLGVPYYTSYPALLPKVEAVSIAVPTPLHFEVSSFFLERGKGVMVEKPMASTLKEASKMIQIAKENGAVLQVGHVERFNPAVMAIERMNLQPLYIESHRVSQFPFRSLEVGVVMDLMIHDIDIILHLVKSPVKKIDALGVAVVSPTEDIANARILFQSGCVANITASRMALKKERKIRVFSRDSYISLDYEKQKALLWRKSPRLTSGKIDLKGLDLGKIPDLKDFICENLLQVESVDMDSKEPLREELSSFLEAVQSDQEPLVTGEHGLKALAAAMEVTRAVNKYREKWGSAVSLERR